MIKKQNGYITPASVYLCINTLDLNSMIFIFEQASEDISSVFSDFEDSGGGFKAYGVLLADRDMRVMEIS